MESCKVFYYSSINETPKEYVKMSDVKAEILAKLLNS